MKLQNKKHFCEVVAIDGPAGAGKSTVAKKAADKLGYGYLDTGAMYRAVTFKALNEKIDFSDNQALKRCAEESGLRFEHSKDSSQPRVFLKDVEVTKEIRTPEVSKNVSAVSAVKEVREVMTKLQREIGNNGKWVVDGRDIGTVVFPNARTKIFLTASIEERAQRRYRDLIEKGFEADLEQLKQDIARRDQLDSNRDVAPLVQAKDAVLLDTTAMTIEQVIDRIIIIVTNTRDALIPTEETMTDLENTKQEQESANENQMTMEQALNESEQFRPISRGAIVTGTVIDKNNSGIYVDLGYKSDGIVPSEEFDAGEADKYNVGDPIKVYVKKIDDKQGQILLSYRRAQEQGSWDELDQAFQNKTPVEGVLKERIKGGYNVTVLGNRAFLPQSQLSHGKNAKENIGKTFKMIVTEFDRKRKNIVVSERAILDEVRDKAKADIFAKYHVDDVIKGTVARIVEYGAFVDLGNGVEGLIHRNDLSWSVISNPREVVNPGDEVEAKILKMDAEKGKISLGLKQKKNNPWETVDTNYKAGQKYHGKVKNLMDFGAFVELEEGVEGLVHISDLSWARNIKHPSEVVKTGDEIDVVVKEIDKDKKRISLSYKEVLPHPWDQVTSQYKIGDIVKGKVNNMTEFGAFIEIAQGVEGLLHISDMDWVKKVNHPKEILEKGQEVSVKILNIDSSNHRLSLGLKQTTDDPWNKVEYEYKIGEQVTGVVKNIVSYGAFVQLANGLEGLLHVSELSWQGDVEKPEDVLKVGDQVTVVVYEIDKGKQKIGLSLRRMQDDPWKEIERKYTKESIHQGKITALLDNGAEVEVAENVTGFVHISQLSANRVNNPAEAVKVGDEVTYKVLELDRKNRRLKLSIKEANMDSDAKELRKYQAESESGFSDTLGDLFNAESIKSLLKK